MNKKQHYLTAMGIDIWQTRTAKAPCAASTSEEPTRSLALNQAQWQALQQEVAACTACGLCKTRTQTVFGIGNLQAKLMIIGEAPGANEDKQGEPFVGRAGQLLNQMLASIGFKREDIFIANILKCRPPNNRDPHADEVNSCTPFLQRQIAFLQPQVLLAVGRIAGQFLLETNQALSKLRGQQHQWGEQHTPLFVTYHPAYLLRSPGEKKKAYLDLLQVKQFLDDLST